MPQCQRRDGQYHHQAVGHEFPGFAQTQGEDNQQHGEQDVGDMRSENHADGAENQRRRKGSECSPRLPSHNRPYGETPGGKINFQTAAIRRKNALRRRRSACKMMVDYFSFSMPSNSTSKTSVAFGPMTGSGMRSP